MRTHEQRRFEIAVVVPPQRIAFAQAGRREEEGVREATPGKRVVTLRHLLEPLSAFPPLPPLRIIRAFRAEEQKMVKKVLELHKFKEKIAPKVPA
ncbi:unnamed protein product [Closterium sp. NIES-54]